jgi:uncharacterized membrane protein
MKALILQTARFVSCIVLVSFAGVSTADYDSLMHGADVMAQGHNPEWSMKIKNKGNKVKIDATGVGDHKFKHPALGPTLRSKQNTTVYHVPNNSHTMNVQVKDVSCTDTVTGKSHEVRVVVWLDNEGYVGCGDITAR